MPEQEWRLTDREMDDLQADASEWFSREGRLQTDAAAAQARKLWTAAWPDIVGIIAFVREHSWQFSDNQEDTLEAFAVRLEALNAALKSKEDVIAQGPVG